MLSRRAVLRAIAVRERHAATPDLSVHALAHELDVDVDDLEDQLGLLARSGLVATRELEVDGVTGAVPCVRLTERGRERVLAVN